MVTRADGDAEFVENHAHIVGVCALHRERHQGALMLRLAIDAQALNLLQALRSSTQKHLLVLLDGCHADAVDIVDSRAESDCTYKV